LNKWDEAYMKTAETFGSLSSAKKLKVGAIVVKEDRIISIGYNGTPNGWGNECEDDDHKTKPEVVHAEANCITKLARSVESAYGSTMYVTHAPCIECAKLIDGAGITKVFYREDFKNTKGLNFLILRGIAVEKL